MAYQSVKKSEMNPDSVYQECLSLHENVIEQLDQSLDGYEVCEPCTSDSKSIDLPELTNQDVIDRQVEQQQKNRSLSPPFTHCQPESQTVKKTKPQFYSLVMSTLALVVSIIALLLVLAIHLPLNQRVNSLIENVQAYTNAEIEDLKSNQSNILDSIKALRTVVQLVNASLIFRIDQELQHLNSNQNNTELMLQNLKSFQNATDKHLQFLAGIVKNLTQNNNSVILNGMTFSGELRGFEPYSDCVTGIERTCTVAVSGNRCETPDLDYIRTVSKFEIFLMKSYNLAYKQLCNTFSIIFYTQSIVKYVISIRYQLCVIIINIILLYILYFL